MIMEEESMNPETVQRAVALASAMNHLKNNRLEYLLLSILLYVTGAGASLLTQAQGVCA